MKNLAYIFDLTETQVKEIQEKCALLVRQGHIRLADCFRQTVSRWGLPEKIYCDNGLVHIDMARRKYDKS